MIRTTITWWPLAASVPDPDEALLLIVPSESDVAIVGSYHAALGFRTSSGRSIPAERVCAWSYWPEVPAAITALVGT